MIPKTTRVLMMMVVPGHLLFMLIIHFMEAGHTTISIQFTIVYLLAALIQVNITNVLFNKWKYADKALYVLIS